MNIPVQTDSTGREHSAPVGACPRWCDPNLCKAEAGGSHQSAPVRIPATGDEVCAVEVWMGRPSRSDDTLFSVEVHYDPEFCAAFDVPTEPDAFVFSRGQARQLRYTLDRLLAA